MEYRAWKVFEKDRTEHGGFALLLQEMLPRTGLNTVTVYKGQSFESLADCPTDFTLTIPDNPSVPEFKQVQIFAREPSLPEAVQAVAR